MSRISLRRA